MQHLIVRQIFDVHLATAQPAYGVQQRLSRFFWESVAPALEQLFDRLAPAGSVIRLDRLEIDIGAFDLDQLTTEEALRRIVSAVEVQLLQLVNDGDPGGYKIATQQGRFEEWLYFLEHGSLPWFADINGATGRQKSIIEILAKNAGAAEQLRRLLQRSEIALDRLVLQHNAAFLQIILTLCGGRSLDRLPAFVQELIEIHQKIDRGKNVKGVSDMPPRQLIAWFWKWSFETIVLRQQQATGETLMNRFFQTVLYADKASSIGLVLQNQPEPPNFPILTRLFQQSRDKSNIHTEPYSSKETATSQTQPEAQKNESSTPQKGDAGAIPPHVTDASLQSPAEPSASVSLDPEQVKLPGQVIPKPEINVSTATDHLKEWHLENTGVVLLANYLTTFFNNLDLIEGKNFSSPENRHKAALLLHFLATGAEVAAEYELVLPKILCGIPLEMPLDAEVPLLAEETAEANALLEAVIGQWTALGMVSPDGLREGFLTRPGKLSQKSNGWRLHIERRTIDILLDRAPFGIGVVKLPWMKDILWVEW